MVSINFNKYKRYKGEWIALVKDRVVSHGKDAKMVYERALEFTKLPTVFRVPLKFKEVYLL